MNAPNGWPSSFLPLGLRSHARPVLWFAGAALLLAVLAWLVPVDAPIDRSRAADANLNALPALPPPEDLTPFLDGRRWGLSPREAIASRTAEQDGNRLAGLNPALKALGYVGLVIESERHTVMLSTTEGGIARLAPGDKLPDGRLLVRVDGHAITLGDGEQGSELEILELFPRAPLRTENGESP